MRVSELIEQLDIKVFEPGANMGQVITGGYSSDLLSDVMGKSKPGQIWITLQNHLNIIAVASLKDLAAIILVHGQEPVKEVADKAREEGITLLGTDLDTFRISAKVYHSLFQDGTGSR